MKPKQRGELALFSAAILYGLFGVFSKIISFQIPIFYQSWVRNVFVVLLLGFLTFFLKKWKPIALRDIVWVTLRSACGFVSYVTLYVAFIRLDIATTYFLSYAATVVAGYILGVVLFKEKLTRKGIVALVLAIGGLLFVYGVNFNSQLLLYLLLAIISGAVLPGWNAFSKKISSKYSLMQLNFLDAIGSFAFPFVLFFVIHEKAVPLAFNTAWITTLFMGLMFLITAFLVVYGFKKVSAQAGILILLFEIIAGIFFGYIFFHQIPTIPSIVGGVLIIASIFLRSGEESL